MQNSSREGFRLSPQQKQLWLWQQAASKQLGSICAVSIEGNLQRQVLREAVSNVVVRHEILFTSFRRPPGMKTPFQVISEEAHFDWQEEDLSASPSDFQQARVREVFEAEQQRLFDFEQDPLFRLSLLRLGDDRHILLINLAAMCGDSRTLSNLIREVAGSYESCLNHKSTAGEPLQYADYAEWQNELLEATDDEAQKGKDYWKKQETFAVRDLILPLERRRAETQVFDPHVVSFEVDRDLHGKIELRAQESQTTPAAVLLACWQALLWRLTGESEFFVSCLFEGRKLEDLSDGLGLYAKYSPVHCIAGNRSFLDYLQEIGKTMAAAEEWQEYYNAVIPKQPAVAFEFEERPPTIHAAGLAFSVAQHFVCLVPFKIKARFVMSGHSLLAELHYDRGVLERQNVERIAGYLQRLLSAVAENPELEIDAIDILDEHERHRQLYDLNQTTVNYPSRCIHELFEEQVEKTPGAIAAIYEDETLTYAQLNAQANQLAHLLRKLGVLPNARVGLCLERSIDVLVGCLGILKAGGAYVPLNPDHPKARLELQLSQSQASVCVTKNGQCGPLEDVDIIDLQHDRLRLESEPNGNPVPVTGPENLVYVIYTSGSTGKPKGVAVSHGNLSNYTNFICERLEIESPLNFATVSPISADLGNTCIFPALVSGGCLHIISHDVAMEGKFFARYLSKHSIDVLKITPSHLNALLASSEGNNVLPAKYLILGGEALTWELFDRIAMTEPNCKLINHYGPTETTVGSLTFSPDKSAVVPYAMTVPIGRPIANTRVYVLDNRLSPVPLGVAGELYISGAGVSRGYLNQPEETAARFIPDPFSNGSGRLYKTGDLVKYLTDGTIEFLGRVDHQVKVRGFRVELGEIEATLREHPTVREAVAVVQRDSAIDERLVAYLVGSGAKPPGQDDLRSFLKQKLPNYMVPSVFVFLKSLPLTANGKVNREALPAPDEARPDLQRSFIGPRTVVEKEVAKIWAELLKLHEVGIHDNFFDLGGHSLLATQVISRMRKAFQLEIPLRSLFELPTISELAEWIERATEAETNKWLSELDALSEEEAQRLFELEQDEAR